MRAWVAYRTFKIPDKNEGFYTVRHVLGADFLGSGSNFNLVIISTRVEGGCHPPAKQRHPP